MAEVKKKVAEKKVAKEPISKEITEITWEKPNGTRVRTNALDANIEYAVELKWERVKES